MLLRNRVGLIGALLVLGSASVAACGDDETSTGGGGTGAGAGGVGGAGGSGGSAPTGVLIPGLSAPVNAVYDQNGILHLTCAADDDCFATLGYFHAQNRFFFMDFIRNLVRGKLGSLVKAGDTVLANDYENRHFFTTREGDPLEQKLYDDASAQVKGHIDAYTRGVNAWIGDMRAGENGATLTTEYDFALIVKENIRDWEPADSAAVGLYVLNDLSNNSPSEISMAANMPAFDPAFAQDLFSARPVFDAFTVPPAQMAGLAPSGGSSFGGNAPSSLFRDAAAALGRVGSGMNHAHPGEIGSNNWVVGPTRTTSGHAILANDPHLSLLNPSIWFPIELDAKSAGTGAYHVAGSTFPGLPSVMIGHNEDIAWGVTTAYWDLADVYVEELSADGTAVIFEGNEVPIFEKEFTFDDSATGTQITRTFRWVPHHGPIVSEDDATNTAVSVRWTGHEGGTDLDTFFGLARAGTTEEARVAIEQASSASQNFVVVDMAGDIGRYPYAKVPSRPWASQVLAPWLPLPGDGSAEWDGSIPFADLPQLTNPIAGAIATANQDMTGANADGDLLNDGQAALQAFSKADGTRQQRILDMLDAGGDAHSVETMNAIQGDNFSLYGEVVVPVILATAAGQTFTAEEQAVVDALTAWQLTCPTGVDGHDPVSSPDASDPLETAESIGCTAFHATLFAITNAALADEGTAAGVPLSGSVPVQLVVRAIKDPASIATGDALWDDVSTMGPAETRDEIILRGISLAAEALAVTGEPNDWRWGRMHTISLRSIYDNFGVATYNDGPYAAPGALYTVNVANPYPAMPESGMPFNFQFSAGPSVRFVVEAGPDRPHMTYQLPGGSDLHRESPFYNNLLPNWLQNTAIEFPFGAGAVADPAVEIVVNPG